MKFLVTGSTGLVGTQVVQDLVDLNHEVFSCYHKSKPSQGIPITLNLANTTEIIDTIKKINPDRIIHLAAMTDVEKCELEPELAMNINANATKIMAKQAANQDTFFVYVSTDYVFDGNNGMKKEHDTPNPLGIYGKSKLAGEIALNNLASSYAIARTSTPFGFHKTKKSFPIWIKENLESEKKIPVLVDQYTSPTFVPNLSKMLIEISIRQLVGIIHTAGASRISRYNLAELIAKKINLKKKFLHPVSLSEMNWKAQRPPDSSLDVSFASEILTEKPQTIQQSLDELFS